MVILRQHYLVFHYQPLKHSCSLYFEWLVGTTSRKCGCSVQTNLMENHIPSSMCLVYFSITNTFCIKNNLDVAK